MHIFRAKKTHYSLFVSQLNKNNLHLTNLEPNKKDIKQLFYPKIRK